MTLRTELERLDELVTEGQHYGFDQTIWRRMLDVLDAAEELAAGVTLDGYEWTPETLALYQRVTGSEVIRSAQGIVWPPPTRGEPVTTD